jgi:hypothetical protein
MVTHAIRAAWLSRNDPPNAPMAVRQAAAITTSFIVFSLPAKWNHNRYQAQRLSRCFVI